jgi:RecJ-like exonuclease
MEFKDRTQETNIKCKHCRCAGPLNDYNQCEHCDKQAWKLALTNGND